MAAEMEQVGCPHCGQVQQLDPDRDPETDVTRCVACGELFSLPQVERAEPPEVTEQRLSAARIRALASRRRAMIRTRTYLVLATVVLVAMGLLLVQKAFAGYRAAGTVELRQAGFLLVAAAALGAAPIPFRHARRIARELAKSDLPEVSGDVDWTGMGDGSQRYRDWEEIR